MVGCPRQVSWCCIAAIAALLVVSSNLRAAWPFQTGGFIPMSPAIADLDGDGDLEIVFGTWDGNCYCLDIHGNQLWATPLYDGTGFPPQLTSSPTLIDLDGNPNTREIVIGSDQDLGNSSIGQLYCLSAEGKILKIFEVPTRIFAAPLVGDLEGDGVLEIVFGHLKTQFSPPGGFHCLTVTSNNGEVQLNERWMVDYQGGSTQFGPSAVDVDDDGILEILVSLNGVNPTVGSLYCLDTDGDVVWTFVAGIAPTYNTPAEIKAEGSYPKRLAVAPYSNDTQCLDALTGKAQWSFPDGSASLLHSPAVADLNGDGLSEIVVGSYGNDVLWAIEQDGQQLWNYSFRPEWTGYSSPGIADVDGDGDLEIAIGTGTPPELGSSRIYLFDHEGHVVWSKIMPSAVYSSPSLADLDGDGFLEIAFGCYDNKFYVLDHQGNTFVPNPNTKPKDLAPWPTYRQNNQRTGFYPGPPKTPKNPGDIAPPPNGNGIVNVDDLLAVINAWGECPIKQPCHADIAPPGKPDGTVNVDDLLMVINNWG